MHYIVHIGPHKTGTTYLQHAFTQMRPVLRGRGVSYPEPWGSIHGHHILTDRLLHGDDEALRVQFAWLEGDPAIETVLLSSETLAYLDDGQVARLRQLLGASPATVVFYFRRWSEVVPSNWRQVLQGGAKETLPGFVAALMANPLVHPIVNFALVLDRYACVFGAENIRVASYSAVMDSGEDLLVHFCRNFLDWPDPPPNEIGLVNQSMDMVDCEIMRTLNVLEAIRGGKPGTWLYYLYRDNKAALPIGEIVERSMQYSVETLRIDDRTLGQLHGYLAQRYRYAMAPPSADEMLFEPRTAAINFVNQEYLLRPGILDLMRHAHLALLALNASR